MILGLDNSFSATNSWRFYTENGAEVFNVNNLNGNVTDASFAAIEMGNVNALFDARAGLSQNSPNPFTVTTMIRFELPTAATATLTIQDIQGRVILSRTIDAAAGTNTATLESDELKGGTGVLTYTLTAGDFTATKKMVVQ